MKKLKHIIIILSVLPVLWSCTDWLDVSSSTQIKGDDLFESEEGFQNALTGIYLNMASTKLYGMNLTWYFTEIMAQPILNRGTGSYHSYYILNNDGYTNATSASYVKAIWETAYTTIANVNNLLKMIDEKGTVVNSRTLNLYKGEALALRAYLHLDLMRLYGYGYYNEREDFDTRLTIPYVTEYALDLTPQRTYSETMKLIIADLTDAIACLAADPIVTPLTDDEQTSVNANGYWTNRKRHVNYYAAKALLARAYMWDGSDNSMAEAVKIAQELTALVSKAYDWNTITNLTDLNVDRTFSTEHLFTLNVYLLANTINPYLTDLQYDAKGKTLVIPWANIAEKVFNAYSSEYDENWRLVYIPGYIGYDDIRFHLHFKTTTYQSNDYMYVNKLYQGASVFSVLDIIPMIKISEMYYILAEDYLARGDEQSALDVINLIRGHRGLQTPLTIDTIENQLSSTVKTELLKEYIREFSGEGQLIYYLKRKGVTSYNSEGIPIESDRTFDDQTYLLPFPTDEVIRGNRVQ